MAYDKPNTTYLYKVMVNEAIYTTRAKSRKQATNNILFKLFGRNSVARNTATVQILFEGVPNNTSSKQSTYNKIQTKQTYTNKELLQIQFEVDQYNIYDKGQIYHPYSCKCSYKTNTYDMF